MDAKELRAKSPAELLDELLKLRKEQFSLRMQRATGQLPKPDQFTKVRRNIARLKTVQRQAALGVVVKAEAAAAVAAAQAPAVVQPAALKAAKKAAKKVAKKKAVKKTATRAKAAKKAATGGKKS
jgi:large subunit ribosomal protein L29